MNTQDIRSIQRFNHFVKGLSQLKEAVDLFKKRLIREGAWHSWWGNPGLRVNNERH